MDSFPPWVDKVRKSPLGSTGYNALTIDRFRWLEDQFGKEHLLQDGTSVGTAGEHNAAEIPREVGSIFVIGGPDYDLEDFRYATGVTRNALGDVSLDLDPDPYSSQYQMSLQVQSCSERWATKPAITGAQIISTSEVRFTHYYLTSALGAGNAWAAEDADFCVAIHGAPLPRGAPNTVGLTKRRGDELSELSTDYNAMLDADAKLRGDFGQAHDASGVHDVREVAKAWAHIGVHAGGGVYDVLASGANNPCVSATWVSAGQCLLEFTDALTLSAQPFLMSDYARLNSGAETDINVCGCPRSSLFTDGGNVQMTVWTYQYDPVGMTWARADADFWVVVHGG